MKRVVRRIAVVCCMLFLMCGVTEAAEVGAVKNAYTDSDTVVLFIKDPGKDIDTAYLGSDEARKVVTEETGPVRTIVVLDNSLSINKKYRDDIKAFLIDLVASRNDGDLFTIATFAENITYLVQDSNDYLNIKDQINGIQFADQDTYFNDTLYTVINDVSHYEDIMYTRVIVIADGVDNESLGYTDEELYRAIESAKVPIYTVGCSSKGNEENLKKMFALSRASGGESYLFEEVPGTDILKSIIDDSRVKKVTIIPQEKSCDGKRQSIRVCFGEDYTVTEAVAPFKAAESPAEETTKAEEKKPSDTESEKEYDAEPEQNEHLPLFTLFGSLAVLAGIAAVAAKRRKKKKASETEPKVDISRIGLDSSPSGESGKWSVRTELIGGNSAEEDSSTDIIVDRKSVRLVLQDMGNSSRTFEYPLRDKVIIGKNASKSQIVIDYSKYISGVHCEIISRGDGFYVRDGGCDVVASTNGTYVNGKKAAPELPLPSGSVLKLGNVSFRVTYK